MAKFDRAYFEHAEGLDSRKEEGDFSIVLKFLDPKPDEKILDVGCGLGRFSYPISQRGSLVTGIDISEYAIKQARQRDSGVENLEYVAMDAQQMNYNHCFDKVLCHHFLEHLTLADARTVLNKIYNTLKNNGIFVLGIPINDFTLLRRIARFMATGLKILDPTHLKSFSLREIKEEITSAGFQITDVSPISYFGKQLSPRLQSMPVIEQVLICNTIIRGVKR